MSNDAGSGENGRNDAATCHQIGTQTTRAGSRVVHGPHVYFIRAGDAVKIGFSERVERRFAGLQSGHATDLELLGAVPANVGTEQAYHQRFAHLHIRGEWFRAEPELLETIAADCAAPSVVIELGPDYGEMYEAFRVGTKHLAGSRAIFWRTQILGRLGQLAINGTVPADMRDWHRSIHMEGLKEARGVFDRMMAQA